MDVNGEIKKLWLESFNKGKLKTERWPLLLPVLEKNCILFIGINPGFSKRDYWENNSIPNPEDYFKWPNKIDEDKEIQREKDARNPNNKKAYYKPYFGPMVNIMKELKDEKWEHLDLFFVRQTSGFKELLNIKKGDYKARIEIVEDFFKKQLEISKKLIEEINPKVIIVCNALASRIMRTEFNKNKDNLNNKYGFHTISLNNRMVPIIFSGMLSGQGVIDGGSSERLIWHIKQALNWYNENNR